MPVSSKPFHHSPIVTKPFLLLAAALTLAACSQSGSPDKPTAAAGAADASQEAVAMVAPAGRYAMDRNHASLEFRVMHLGLAPYVLRFVDFDVSIELDPLNHANSLVEVTIDPKSIRSDHDPSRYQATHKNSPFGSFDEDLALSPKFLNADEHPRIAFRSTRVERLAADRLRVIGDLSLLGKTRPVTLEATVTGFAAAHPFTKKAAIGFSATGSFRRSDFGMTHLVEPPLVSDKVTLRFDGEFQRADQPAS